MNKETFLEELRGCLEVLEDQEQQDILEEYAQHIDIKIQNGQSEEDAIRDFGPLKELAAEILEAYHVKPEFGEGRGRKGLPGIGSVNLKAGEKKLRGFGTALRNGLAAAGNGIGRAFRSIGRAGKRFFCWIASPFQKRRESGEGRQDGVAEIPEINRTERAEAGKAAPYGFLKKLGHGIGSLICWFLRLCWNIFWLFFALCTGCFALAALFGFGMMLILLFQEYPLGGATLVCLGCFLAGGSMAGICMSLIRRKEQKKEADKGPGKEPAEGQAGVSSGAGAELETEEAPEESEPENDGDREPEEEWQEVQK